MDTSSRWFISQQFRKFSTQWAEAIARHENLSVLFIPKTDRLRRLDQFIHDQELLHRTFKNKTVFQFIDLGIVDDRQELLDILAKELNRCGISSRDLSFPEWISFLKKESIFIVLILPDAEKYLTSHGKDILLLLSNVIQGSDGVMTVMSFYESDLTHPSLLPFMPATTSLYENISYYPLYSFEDTLQLVQYLRERWGIPIEQKKEHEIVDSSGGHLWLAAEAVREMVSTGSWSPNQEGMNFRLQTVYNSFLHNEQQVLQKIVTKKEDFSPEERHSLSYLQKMRVVDGDNRCRILLLEEFILSQIDEAKGLALNNGKMFFNQVPLDKFFSRKEYRMMRIFFERKNTIVSRDDIAKAIWPTNTASYYSDWAIDQTVARLRKRLSELSISPKVLQVVRGKGYIFKTTHR